VAIGLGIIVTLGSQFTQRMINVTSSLSEIPAVRQRLAQPLVVIDSTKTYQTIVGWEGTYGTVKFNPMPDRLAFQARAFDMAVNDVGLTRLRFEIGMPGPAQNARAACPAPVEGGWDFACFDAIMDGTVEFKRLVEARGDRFWLNVTVVGNRGSLEPEYYAQQVLAIYQHMQHTYGFLPDSWEVALEPGMFKWDSATTLARAMLATARALERGGYGTPYFVAPSSECGLPTALQWFQQLAATPGAVPLVKEFAYHRYCAPSDDDLRRAAAIRETYGINTSQLEFIGASYNELHEDLKKANVSAWQQYLLFHPAIEDKGGQYLTVDTTNPVSPIVRVASRTKFLRQYFKFVRPGAIRIEATTSDASVDPVAFVNADGRWVVVLKSARAADFGVAGLPAGQYGIKYTTHSEYDVDRADVLVSAGQELTASIPAAGVATVYAR
jgi:glucosylceramidase